MTRQRKMGGRRAAMLVALSLCAGCQSGSRIDPAESARVESFNIELAESTTAINSGDLATARQHLDAASDLAKEDAEQAKVASLDTFIVGAEALLVGDVELARLEWSRIEDDALGAEVRTKAGGIGVAVPDTPQAPDGAERTDTQ
ncbi:MAG: hypothetical protein ACYTF9_02120 [Planctomycetota bacterium]